MQYWWKVCLLLCVFGFLKEIRPSEPFVYQFLTGEWRNITGDQVNQEVYPVSSYAYLAQLVIVFLVTDFARYKPLIVVLGMSAIVVWSMLLWTTSLLSLQILEVFYATMMATEVAYFTYIYAKVDTEYYQKVTGFTRAAILAGRCFSGVLAQLLISFKAMDYKQLNYITFGAMILATFWAIWLPPVKRSIYFHHPEVQQHSIPKKTAFAFRLMSQHFMQSYTNKYIVKWSVWWALSTCCFIQVQTYIQSLWSTISEESDGDFYNGLVEAVLTILGFLGALLGSVLRINWKTKGDLCVTIISLLQGFILVITSQTTRLAISYVCYVAFGAIYHLSITIASTEIAKVIQVDSHGLIFGINTFVAAASQSILTTVVVTSNAGFGLGTRTQFVVYGIYHVVLGALYIVIGLVTWLKRSREPRRDSLISS